jgi:RNA polymerase sigma factor (sigma-70 family)
METLAFISANSETVVMDSRAASGIDEAAILGLLRDPQAVRTERHLAFQRLHEIYSPDLLAFLRTKVGRSPMSDVEQTVWLQVWQKIATHFDGKNFRAWLYQIARNESVNHHRNKRKATSDQFLDRVPDHRLDLSAEDEERRRVLEDCLSQLDPRSRDVIRARLNGSSSNEEIAKRFSLSIARLFSLVSEAKSKLTRCVKGKTA